MKTSLFTLLLVWATMSLQAQQRQPKVVFILLDGISADVIERLKPPVLTEISAQGGFTPAIVGGVRSTPMQSPTISAVGYNSLITGTWVNKHHVFDNSIRNPNYNYWTIFRIAESANPAIHTAIFSTWTDNRTKLVGEGKPETGHIKLDYAFDGLELDTGKFPHRKDSYHIYQIDEAVAIDAARYIGAKGPDLSWVYLEYTDDIGHRYGDSPAFDKSILQADSLVGIIWTAVKARMANFPEDWLVVVTTDHGRDPRTGKSHGGQTDRERSSWLVTNYSSLNPAFRYQPAIVDVAPSIARFLKITPPVEVTQEWDGVPFIGQVDLAGLQAKTSGKSIQITWKCLNPAAGDLEIWVCPTNQVKSGGADTFVKQGTVKATAEAYVIKETRNEVFKISVRSANQQINTWVVRE